jgi:ribosomal protein S27E
VVRNRSFNKAKSDFMVVQYSECTFMTGGELVNGKREEKMTETYGESIRVKCRACSSLAM